MPMPPRFWIRAYSIPGKGGEGKITGQYLLNQLHRALQFIERGAFKQATDCLKAALRYPDNLGRGDCLGKRITISGICWATAQNRLGMRSRRRNITSLPGKGLNAGRRAVLQRSTRRLSFWQGIALRKSGNPAQAEQYFRHFIDWAAQHRDDVPQVDFCRLSSGPGGSRCISAAETSAALLVY